jgi:hypothetical protein
MREVVRGTVVPAAGPGAVHGRRHAWQDLVVAEAVLAEADGAA